jgi:hypothetical protein
MLLSQVARTRTYTPTIDDVGYVLRYQVNIVDKTHASYVDASKIQMFDTTRVRPAPNPPARHMVQLMPESAPQGGPGPSGRFTLLTYNLLADIYAKASARRCMGETSGRMHGGGHLGCMHGGVGAACMHGGGESSSATSS